MVFNVNFNNISAISWQSVLLVEKTRMTRRKPLTSRKSLTNFITYNLHAYGNIYKQSPCSMSNICTITR